MASVAARRQNPELRRVMVRALWAGSAPDERPSIYGLTGATDEMRNIKKH
jgi:hypothetical protein